MVAPIGLFGFRFCVGLAADNKVTAAELGAIEAVLDAMRAHRQHAGVQEEACAALWGLAVHGERPLLPLRYWTLGCHNG